MIYRSTRDCVEDLDRHGMLLRIKDEVNGHLEMAAIQRQAYAAGGPAIYFERIKGSKFSAVSNLFGTTERSKFIFRSSFKRTQDAIKIKAHPEEALRKFWRYWHAPLTGLLSLPKKTNTAPVLSCETTIDQLPWIKSWPLDGGPFITLPQVYTEDPDRPGIMNSNLGMYRIQLSGNDYVTNKEIGLHYQIHRGIGVHHTAAVKRGESLKVAVFVGGPPAHTFAAVMPLPEGLSELVFAGMLAGRRFRYTKWQGWTVAADADFCILGTVDGSVTKPEGPFGDHLGYYSLKHDFPVMKVERVFHRPDAIWPFTVVGRPPQEDTSFGSLIHELTKPMVPVSIPGVRAMHAVDSAGVHPLLFVLGSERYVPYQKGRPQELLTQASAVLGFNQASLAKYLLIADNADNERLQVNDEEQFLRHVLERVDWSRDLHFHTRTTIDTLDYSGSGLNEGSKVVMAARGGAIRTLGLEAPTNIPLPPGFSDMRYVMAGVLAVNGPKFSSYESAEEEIKPWTVGEFHFPKEFPLVVIVGDAEFASKTLRNFLWVSFTRSQPSHDLYGVESFMEHKHWGCLGSLILDARIKHGHAPPLVEDAEIEQRASQLLSRYGLSQGKKEV